MGAAYKICPACAARPSAELQFCPACGADLESVSEQSGDPHLGMTIAGKYHLRELIGEGAMGKVYKAEQTTLGKPFAVKILLPSLTGDDASQQRFANEAHNAASLNHPNCVSVVDYGRSTEGVAYIVMEFIQGITLEQILTEQYPISGDRIVDLILQILAALTEAHGLGILHRDLKPENILVQTLRTHGELIKVLDFGIAKLMDNAPTASQRPGLTNQGMVCGTPEYMSPEQARGQALDARSDLYAVGVVLYQALTGRPPFESESAIDVLHKHLHEAPTPPSKVLGREIGALETVCLRALSKDPNERFESANDFREALIATTAQRTSQTLVCQSCGSDMRLDDKFCASCGAPAPDRPQYQRKRHPTRRSGLNIPVQRDRERTAELVVRSFPLPLVGRDQLLQQAHALLSRPRKEAHVKVFTGPPGVGKTRMADEMASLAEQLGWRVFYVGADPTNCGTPLWPLRQMVAQILDVDPHVVTTQDLGRAANLSGLAFEELPGLAELFQLDGPAHTMEYHVRRRECFAAAIQALLHGGRGEPLFLVFDDVDAFDTPSRDILRRLSTVQSSVPLTIVMTTTEGDPAWLEGDVLSLDPLSESAVSQLCRQVTLGINPESALPATLTKAAPLTPLRLELQLRMMALGIEPPSDATDGDLVRMRVQQLGTATQTVLEHAAVLGERFPEADLLDLVGLDGTVPEKELDEILAELHVGGLLLITGSGERAFSHRKVHDLVYANITAARRQLLHARVATASRIAQTSAAVLAMNLLRSGSEDAIEALEEAADAAVRCFDDPSASEHLHSALRACGPLPEDTRLLATQARLADKASNVMRQKDSARAAIDLLEAQLRKRHADADIGRLSVALGQQLARQNRHDEAATALKRGLGPAIAGGDRDKILQVYGELGGVYMRQGDYKRALSELHEGLDMCTMGEGPRADIDLGMWRYLMRISDILRASGELRQAREWCEHALFQAERRNNALGRLRCHAQMAFLLRESKQITLGEKHLARALEETRYFGDRLTTAELLLERARGRASHGKITEARRSCEDALRLARIVDWSVGVRHAERAIEMFDQHA